MSSGFFSTLGVMAAIIMPIFNVPLIVKIIKRKSSKDLSMSWVVGVWICFVLMAPSGFTSEDVVWKTFNIVNLALFTIVFAVSWRYRNGVEG